MTYIPVFRIYFHYKIMIFDQKHCFYRKIMSYIMNYVELRLHVFNTNLNYIMNCVELRLIFPVFYAVMSFNAKSLRSHFHKKLQEIIMLISQQNYLPRFMQ